MSKHQDALAPFIKWLKRKKEAHIKQFHYYSGLAHKEQAELKMVESMLETLNKESQ